MLGVRLNGEPRAYLFQDMGLQAVINDRVGDIDVVVVWDEASQLAIPYTRQAGDQLLTFDHKPGGFPFNMRDLETGSTWDINGVAIDGPLTGHRLTQVPAHNSFWFAWVTFFEESTVWQP
jgi:hypothetical protein